MLTAPGQTRLGRHVSGGGGLAELGGILEGWQRVPRKMLTAGSRDGRGWPAFCPIGFSQCEFLLS